MEPRRFASDPRRMNLTTDRRVKFSHITITGDVPAESKPAVRALHRFLADTNSSAGDVLPSRLRIDASIGKPQGYSRSHACWAGGNRLTLEW